MPSPTVLVLGSRGRLGRALVGAFAHAGWQVLAHRRAGGAQPALPPGAQPLECPLASLGTSACPRADVVVHAANPAYDDRVWRREAPMLMDHAIAAARRSDALLLFAGNVYNFGAGMPQTLCVDTPQRPTTGKGAVRVALEAQLQSAARGGVRSAVLRAGDFFGAHAGSYFDLVLARDLRRGRMVYPGALDTPTAWAYLPDLARAFVGVAQRREHITGAQAFHFGGHTLSGRDWLQVLEPLARARGWLPAGKALRVQRFPWRLIRMGGLLVPSFAAMARMRYLWQTPHRLANAQLVDLLGEEPHTPFAQAVAASLEQMHPTPVPLQRQAA